MGTEGLGSVIARENAHVIIYFLQEATRTHNCVLVHLDMQIAELNDSVAVECDAQQPKPLAISIRYPRDPMRRGMFAQLHSQLGNVGEIGAPTLR